MRRTIRGRWSAGCSTSPRARKARTGLQRARGSTPRSPEQERPRRPFSSSCSSKSATAQPNAARKKSRGLLGQNAQDMFGSLCHREEGDFVERVAARAVPPDDPRVDVNRFGKRLVAFLVGGVDLFPWRQHEHGRMERIGTKHGFEFARRQRRRFMEQAKRVDQTAIEKHPRRRAALSEV